MSAPHSSTRSTRSWPSTPRILAQFAAFLYPRRRDISWTPIPAACCVISCFTTVVCGGLCCGISTLLIPRVAHFWSPA